MFTPRIFARFLSRISIGFLLALVYLGSKYQMPTKQVLLALPANFNDVTNGGVTIPFFYLATIMPAFIISPGILQKVFAARNERAARFGVGINAAGLIGSVIGAVIALLVYRAMNRRI